MDIISQLEVHYFTFIRSYLCDITHLFIPKNAIKIIKTFIFNYL